MSDDQPSRTLHFSLRFGEFISAFLYVIIHMRATKKYFFLLTVLIIISFVLGQLTTTGAPVDAKMLLSLVFPILLVIGIFLALILVVSSALYIFKPVFFKNLSYEFTESGTTRLSTGKTFVTPWTGYVKWRETKAFFLLYNNGSNAQIIPKRVFESADELDDFREAMRNNIKERN